MKSHMLMMLLKYFQDYVNVIFALILLVLWAAGERVCNSVIYVYLKL